MMFYRMGTVAMSWLAMSYLAGATTTAPAATTKETTQGAVFVYNSTTTGTEIIFALNVDADTRDVYFHMAVPAGNSWLGIGFGDSMINTRMLIAYESANGSGVTLSPRLSTSHSEPSYDPSVDCELVWNADLPGANSISAYGWLDNEGYMTVDAVCRNATTWSGGSLPFGAQGSTAQPFIFAVGPGWSLQSDSMTANLREHDYYGHFTMDMQAATTTNAGVPIPNGFNGSYITLNAAATATGLTVDNSNQQTIHGLFMCLVFVIIFPLGSLLLRLFNRVWMHVVLQVLGFAMAVAAMGLGIYISTLYNHSRHFNSPHQILGMFVMVLLLAQLGLGMVNHALVVKQRRNGSGVAENKGRSVLAWCHLVLGPGAIVLGIVNAGIGFTFADNAFLTTRYAIVVVAIGLIYLAIRCTAHFCRKLRKDRQEVKQDGDGAQGGYQYPEFVPPPGYTPAGAGQGYGQQVPLQQYPAQPYPQEYGQPFQAPPQQYQMEQQYPGQPMAHQRPPYQREPSSFGAQQAPMQARTLV